MKELAQRNKRYGSSRIHILLKKEGLVINHKKTERIYKEEGLSLRKRIKKKHILPFRIPMPEASRPNEVWSIDFMSDAYGERNLLKILTMVDDFSRLSPGILAKRSITGKKVTEFIDQVSLFYGYPKRIRVDNGPEFSSRVFHQWAATRGVLIEHIRPGKPQDNAYIESFNGKFRDDTPERRYRRQNSCIRSKWRARWDLNPGSPAPQASVIIRTRPRAPTMHNCP